MSDQYHQLKDIVEAWRTRRAELVESEREQDDDGARTAWLRKFATAHNTLTRQLVRELHEESPEFWSALKELAGNAHRVIRGETVWEQLKFWVRDFRDSFGHAGASDGWADQLRVIRADMTGRISDPTDGRSGARLWRRRLKNRSAKS